MDYILLLALKNNVFKRIVVSYDIACQYSKKFPMRVVTYPKEMQLDLKNCAVEFVVPQFHVAGHGEDCRSRNSFRYREHMGRTDGENFEQGWAIFNPLSMATREMGPGSRHDTINYHFNDSNFQRVISLGERHIITLNPY